MNTWSFFHNKVLIFIIYVLLILCLLNTSIKMLYSITSNALGKSKYVRPTQLSFSIRTVRLFKKKMKTQYFWHVFWSCLKAVKHVTNGKLDHFIVWMGELICFILAHTVLWFGFVIKTVLITQQYFSYC